MTATTEGVPAARPPRSLRQAVVTALVLLGLVAVFVALGPHAFFFLAAAVLGIVLYEVFSALHATGRKPSRFVGITGGLAAITVAGPFVEEPALVLVVFATVAYAAFGRALMPGRSERPAADVAWTVLGATWIGGGGAGATYILTLSDSGALLLTAYVLITALNDIGAFFIGTAFGRHKMAPSISPNKSWEGWVGGLVVSLLGGAAFGLALADLSALQGVGLALISSLLAPLGDFSASLFKREMGIKDSGQILPGHGGLLDRVDAIAFAAPVAAVYLRFVVF